MCILQRFAALFVVVIWCVTGWSISSQAAINSTDLKPSEMVYAGRISGSFPTQLQARLSAPLWHKGIASGILQMPIDIAHGPYQVPLGLTPRPELGTPAEFFAMPDGPNMALKQVRKSKALSIDLARAVPHKKTVYSRQIRELNKRLFKPAGLEVETGCLAVAIYYEARGETRLGQIAISQVVLNRVKSRKYPNTICDVVYQNAHMYNRCQFSFTCDGRAEDPRDAVSWQRAKGLAKSINCGNNCHYAAHETPPLMLLSDDMRRSTHYHATYVAPSWAYHLIRSGKIGQHIFYISARVWS